MKLTDYEIGDRIYVNKYNNREADPNHQAATVVGVKSTDRGANGIMVRFDNPLGHPTVDTPNHAAPNIYLTFEGVPEDGSPNYWYVEYDEIYEHKVKRTKISERMYHNRIFKQDEEHLWIAPN